ncbi:OadG family protein [Vibrio ziniensis]|uniref:Probable oxaloacetate decarboxylase gamma chain n=1 Tax=Vibrio ziniensis TaxID=2711221 RepID=A0A6G7CIX9_9VIBR|nr:OadG family protein [Vibrio ziniensis]QIH42059.1 sodium pump decarboxylase subunit gamma [Vibrio ziniensis]
MNEGPIILEGVNLMFLGMGFVFCFLALLVAATRLLSTLSIKFSPPEKSANASKHVPAVVTQDDHLIAAISAVLHHHNQKTNKQVQA